jgi:hypothetical protein
MRRSLRDQIITIQGRCQAVEVLSNFQIKKRPDDDRSVFELLKLGLLDVRRARTLVGFLGVEAHLVALVELIKGDADQGGRVEKHVLVRSVWGDETKTLFGLEALDDTGHIRMIL